MWLPEYRPPREQVPPVLRATRLPAKTPQRKRKGCAPANFRPSPTPAHRNAAGSRGISKGIGGYFSGVSWPNPEGKPASRLPPPSSGFRGRHFPLSGLGYGVTTPHAVAGRKAGPGSRAPGGCAGKARGPGSARTLEVQSPARPL